MHFKSLLNMSYLLLLAVKVFMNLYLCNYRNEIVEIMMFGYCKQCSDITNNDKAMLKKFFLKCADIATMFRYF